MKAIVAAVAVAVAVAACCVPAPAAAADEPGCTSAEVGVTALALRATIHGTLCLPSTGKASTVMVLVPGATYNGSYWDFPYQPRIYNFRQAMNAAGYATFVIDPLGTGESSRPPSVIVTTAVQALAVHEVIAALRNGSVDGIHFAKLILGGHSLGSAVAILEAGTYNDENGLLLTGISHQANVGGFASLLASLYPAMLDPQFAGRSYGPGYLATQPGSRGRLFHSPQTMDPVVVAQDEATKDVVSAGEIADAAVASFSPYSDLIRVPVLIADGQDDRFFCSPLSGNCKTAAALRVSEAPYYRGTSCLTTYILPGAGHDLSLAIDTQEYQRAVQAWAADLVVSGC